MTDHGLKKQLPIRRRDVGIAGAVIVLAEVLSNFQSSNNVATEVLKFKEEFQASKLEQEKFFVRKNEVDKISRKLDKMNDHLVELNSQVVSLRSFLQNGYGYHASSKDEDLYESLTFYCVSPNEEESI